MPATAAGMRPRKQLNVAVATSSVDPTGALLACNDHVRFEQHSVEHDILLEEGVKHRMKDDTGNFLVALVRMRAIHQHFWLDDRHELLLLRQSAVPRERIAICTHTYFIFRRALALT